MKKFSKEEFIQKSKNIFKDEFDYSKVEYINSKKNIILICKIHGDFFIAPKDHLSYKRGCKFCGTNRYTTQSFIERANQIHNYEFDYSKTQFVNALQKVIIICKIHGEFNQTPDKHINSGQKCKKCQNPNRNLEYFLLKAKEIHGDKYDYSKVKFNVMFKKVEIICKIHGSFWQTPANHLNHKQDCFMCAKNKTKLSQDEFIIRSQKIHNFKYDYTNVIYINCITRVEIICKIHGMFLQRPRSHLNGASCPMCVGAKSKKEEKWLNSLNIKIRNYTIYSNNKRYIVDGYDPETNTIYEFYGDYWHGNPMIYNPEYINKHNKIKFSILYEKTIKRKNDLLKLGFNIISIWENDFDKINVIDNN